MGVRQSRYSLTIGKPYLGFRLTPFRRVGGWTLIRDKDDEGVGYQKYHNTVTVTVTVTDNLLQHELQKSLHPSPVVSRLLRQQDTGTDLVADGFRLEQRFNQKSQT